MGEVHVARRSASEDAVALKILSRVSPTNLYRFKREFRALADVVHRNLVRLHELGLAEDGRPFFTMGLVDGEPFVDWVRAGLPANSESEHPPPPDMARLLDAFVQLVDGVRVLHERRCIHRDLKPSNVLVDASGRVVILDFGLVSELEEPEQGVTLDGQLLGTPAYMAPEQAVGLRAGPASDYYALGVMLFECLVGTRPPMASPFGEHAEARVEALREGLAMIDEPLRLLCIDLLDVEPANRPHAAAIVERLGAESSVSAVRERISAPAAFVGREAELERLHQAYRDSLHEDRPVIVHLCGRSGQGKSALLQRFRHQLRRDRSLFLHGRCREQESVPYKGVDALIDALSAYLRRLPEHQRKALRPPSAEALVQMFPVLDELWPRATNQALGAAELPKLSRTALHDLLQGIAGHRPLVLQIDDFQWSDLDSVQLLDKLLDGSPPLRLLLILAMRTEAETAPLAKLAASKALTQTERRIELGPLSTREAIALATSLAEELPGPTGRAETIALRAGGNPFYIGQLLRNLDDSRSTDSDLDAVVTRRLHELAGPARSLLELVAVAGGPLALRAALDLVPEASTREVELLHDQAMLVGGEAEIPGTKIEAAHDRIREVVLATLTPSERVAHHRALGHKLLNMDAGVYEIVEHLNWTIETEADPAALWRLAQLDLDAGLAGLRASAPAMAIRQLDAGLRAAARARKLGSAASTTDNQLALALALQHARCVSLLGDHARASALFDAIMAEPLDALAYAEVALVRVDACTIADQPDEAIRWGVAGLARLDVDIAAEPSTAVALGALLRLRWAFRSKVRTSLSRLPPCEDPTAQLRMKLLGKLVGPAFVVGDKLVPVLIRALSLESLRSGKTPAFGFYLILVSLLHVGGLQAYVDGAELAMLALELAAQPGATRRGITHLVAHGVILHWTRPHVECLAGVEASFELALAEGDLEYATYASMHRVGYQSALGHPLAEVREAADKAARFARETGMTEFARAIRCRALVSDVLTGVETELEFDPFAFDQLYPRCVAVVWATQALVFLHRAEEALRLSASVADKADEGLAGFYLQPEFVFYRGLAAAMCMSPTHKPRALRRVLTTCRRRLDAWAALYPDNLEPCARMLEAEHARVRGRTEQAQSLYEAVLRATADSRVHIAALACERLGRLMKARAWNELARAPLTRAAKLYGAWGALAKVDALTHEFPELDPARADASPPSTPDAAKLGP